MNVVDNLHQLQVSDRLRVAAGVLDDAAAGRVDRTRAIARVLDILSLTVRHLITELLHGGQHHPSKPLD